MYIVIHVCITVLFLLKIQYEIKTEISAIPLTMGKRKKTLKTSSKLSAKIYVKLNYFSREPGSPTVFLLLCPYFILKIFTNQGSNCKQIISVIFQYPTFISILSLLLFPFRFLWYGLKDPEQGCPISRLQPTSRLQREYW